MSEQKDLERAAFEDFIIPSWSLEKRTDSDGDTVYVEDWVQGAWIGWQKARSLPVGVPDVSELQRLLDDVRDVRSADDVAFGWYEAVERMLAAAPTVKAEQVPTPEFVWVRLLEALAGDNGCPFTASTDDYREAKPALIQLIEAGFFRDDADSLDGDIWMVASGEQGEADARFASCAESYAYLSDVLNRVFERDDQAYDRNAERLTAEALGTGSGINMAATSIDELFDEPAPPMPAEKVQCATCQDSGIVGHSDVCPECQDTWQPAPSLPAAGSALSIGLPSVAEFGEWVGPEGNGPDSATRGMLLALFKWTLDRVCALNANRAALSAQQSAHVSVPRELLRAVCSNLPEKMKPARRKLSAILNGGEA